MAPCPCCPERHRIPSGGARSRLNKVLGTFETGQRTLLTDHAPVVKAVIITECYNVAKPDCRKEFRSRACSQLCRRIRRTPPLPLFGHFHCRESPEPWQQPAENRIVRRCALPQFAPTRARNHVNRYSTPGPETAPSSLPDVVHGSVSTGTFASMERIMDVSTRTTAIPSAPSVVGLRPSRMHLTK